MSDRNEEFLRLLTANQRRIFGFISALVPRSSDADDVYQEVSLALWRKFDQFEPGTDFAAWANQFARYLVLKHCAKQRRLGRLVFDEELLAALADDVAAAASGPDERLEALRGCLEKLPAHSRRLLELRYESGLKTVREVAARVGRSVDATYKAISRIHDALLRCMEGVLTEVEET